MNMRLEGRIIDGLWRSEVEVENLGILFRLILGTRRPRLGHFDLGTSVARCYPHKDPSVILIKNV